MVCHPNTLSWTEAPLCSLSCLHCWVTGLSWDPSRVLHWKITKVHARSWGSVWEYRDLIPLPLWGTTLKGPLSMLWLLAFTDVLVLTYTFLNLYSDFHLKECFPGNSTWQELVPRLLRKADSKLRFYFIYIFIWDGWHFYYFGVGGRGAGAQELSVGQAHPLHHHRLLAALCRSGWHLFSWSCVWWGWGGPWGDLDGGPYVGGGGFSGHQDPSGILASWPLLYLCCRLWVPCPQSGGGSACCCLRDFRLLGSVVFLFFVFCTTIHCSQVDRAAAALIAAAAGGSKTELEF